MGCQPTIHVNPHLDHQKKLGVALADGFKSHGITPVLTTDPKAKGDFHVVLGPWFALKEWRFDNTLYIDRAYWNDPRCVSIHWLSNGEKVRTKGNPYRRHPTLAPIKTGDRRLYLCDYKQKPLGRYHTVRYHPADKTSRYSLDECLKAHDVAIGRRTTALVDAHIQGLRVETDDPHSPVADVTDRDQWITDLAWHNWSHDEISRGAMWNHIRSR
jgi:hypothetical protein